MKINSPRELPVVDAHLDSHRKLLPDADKLGDRNRPKIPRLQELVGEYRNISGVIPRRPTAVHGLCKLSPLGHGI
jgi:hypothetical protein